MCVCVCYKALIVIMSAIMCPNCVFEITYTLYSDMSQYVCVCECVSVCLPLSIYLTYLFALSTTSLLTHKTHAMPSLVTQTLSLWLCAAAIAVAIAASAVSAAAAPLGWRPDDEVVVWHASPRRAGQRQATNCLSSCRKLKFVGLCEDYNAKMEMELPGNGQRGDIKETEDRKKISVLM